MTIRLTVAAWTLPKPQDYLTWVDFIDSPESVALRYEVPLWSDKHFELMASSFAPLGEELAKKCQDLLDDRMRALLASMSEGNKAGEGLQESTTEFADGPWQERSAKLYAAAADAAKALGDK